MKISYHLNILLVKHIYSKVMIEPEIILSRELFIESSDGKIDDHYDFIRELGRGAYGVVYLAFQKETHEKRAIKSIKKAKLKDPKSFFNQIQILMKLDHPNIIKIYQTFQDHKFYHVVTEYCEGGELFDRLSHEGKFSEEDARIIFKQILYAIKYCHNQHVAHRDLKPENFIFLQKKSLSLKIIDFGLSYIWKNNMRKQLQQNKQVKLIGTPYYIAPEILQRNYDQRCDIWSLGVILYILVTAAPPFDGETNQEIMMAVMKGKYTFNIPEMKNVTQWLKELITKMLVPDSQRITIEEIFEHPWMRIELDTKPLKLKFNRLQNYSKFSKLKKFAISCIASQMSPKQIESLGVLFQQIDTNHDGFISSSELKAALEKQKQDLQIIQLESLLKCIDTDHNGKINYCEFVASCLETSVILRYENLLYVFKKLDKDGSGKINPGQLKQALIKTNPDLNQRTVKQIIKSCDLDGDGFIEFGEFQKSIRG